MVKKIDTNQNLPLSSELRTYPTSTAEQKVANLRRWIQQKSDFLVDCVFRGKKLWRRIRETQGYLAGPVLFGIPFLFFGWRALAFYQKRVDAGKIMYRRHAPEYLHLPPADIKQQPVWNKEHLAPLRRIEPLSSYEIAREQGCRFAGAVCKDGKMDNRRPTAGWLTRHSAGDEPEPKKMVEA